MNGLHEGLRELVDAANVPVDKVNRKELEALLALLAAMYYGGAAKAAVLIGEGRRQEVADALDDDGSGK